MYADRKPPGNPPCENCRETLLDENVDVANVFMLTRGQVIAVGEGRVIDISIPAVKIAMDLLGVKNQRDCLMRVMNCFHYFQRKAGNGG